MVATFHGNSNTTIIPCYSPTNVSEELKVEQFYMELHPSQDRYLNTIC